MLFAQFTVALERYVDNGRSYLLYI